MEKSGIVKVKHGRAKFAGIILTSLFLLFVIFIATRQLIKEKKMQSHSSIKGIVQNNAGTPVADAVVMIKEGSHEFNDIASVTNDSGEFFLSNIFIPGRYVIQVQHDSGTITKEVNLQTTDSIIRISL